MLKGITENGELKNVKVSEDGEIYTKNSSTETSGSATVETTLNASVQTIGTEASIIEINQKITTIDIANYSENANILITVGGLEATIGSNIATTLTINKDIESISLVSTEANTKVQVIIKGVE